MNFDIFGSSRSCRSARQNSSLGDRKFSKFSARYIKALYSPENMASAVDERMNMEQWCSDTDRGSAKYSEKGLSAWPFLHQKSHMKWP